MKKKSLANLLRPRLLCEIKGQRQTTDVLQSQLANGNFANTYIFAGKYGCGKTSAARAVAMAVTCENPREDGNPCCCCGSCKALMDHGSNANVTEVNAASNRGIGDIREIIDNMDIPPQGKARKRVFILDECHMLTAEASNALLKTLEEPPEWVMFILCTTEADRILPTIRSRCQLFKFEPIEEHIMAQAVRDVLDEQHISYEEKVPQIMAHLARGSFRDCLSALDQCMDFIGEGKLFTVEDVCRIKGVASLDAAYEMVGAYLNNDVPTVLAVVNSARYDGTAAISFTDGVMEMVLDAMFEANGMHQENGYDMSVLKLDTVKLLDLLESLSGLRARLSYFSDPYIQIMGAVLKQMDIKASVSAEHEDFSDMKGTDDAADGFVACNENTPFEKDTIEPKSEQTSQKRVSFNTFFGLEDKPEQEESSQEPQDESRGCVRRRQEKLQADYGESPDDNGPDASDGNFDFGF